MLFLLFLVSNYCIHAKLLRECAYLDENCKEIIGCEYRELETCLVRTEPNPKSKILETISFTLSTDGKSLRTDMYTGNDHCEKTKDNYMNNLIPLELNTCTNANQPPFRKIVSIIDSLDSDERKPIAYFTNSTLGLTEKGLCDKVTVIESMFSGCTSFPDGTSAMYRIHNNKLLCEAFNDNQCIAYRDTILEQQCETCFSEKIDEGVYQYRQLHCGSSLIDKVKNIDNTILNKSTEENKKENDEKQVKTKEDL
ncbi:hypothetical protein EDI_158720 [Entamoeba dispar SAW760]|uniref:Uncharacterized protein n=1 Tax=Entamoeba dispar (strain ATCC PRA-260 / SAW760) TaxID=370354 RepID=B0E9T7_ENTDS|nr:uncharacterized protein EDI_158720 [Entamoeba dispar SAW760]EDR28734.1 hypothetical protein EDI_158720 [Entamoeba dispar SAW760]|eukprot:EDR28734.1 hypothetical protein EDI_158720 [Entamoeba dispar SAW760]